MSHAISDHPKDDAVIKRLLKQMPQNIAASFTTEQLIGLREAVAIRGSRLHSVDVRPTFQLPFLPWSFYMVLLLGRNRRKLSGKEKALGVAALLFMLSLFATTLFIGFLVVLYLLKSFLGINILDEYSLGLWDWVKSSFE